MKLSESSIRQVFHISLWLKAAHSVIEIISGLALALLSHDLLLALASAMTSAELLEDPHDLIANQVRHLAQGFSSDVQSFSAYYLFSHGLIKLVLVAGVLANKVWAYPAFIAAMIGFIVYQLYRLSHGFSLLMVAITVLDVVVLALAWHEYKFVKAQAT